MQRIITKSAEETRAVGRAFAKTLRENSVVALFGTLGVGKTAFVGGVCGELCPDAFVQSPTFTIVNEYEGALPVFHFDMYRVESADELYYTGFYEYLKRGGVSLIEWSENIEQSLPEDAIRVRISYTDTPDEREIIIEGGEMLCGF